MTATWVLVILLHASGSGMVVGGFSSEKLCEQARARAVVELRLPSVDTYCQEVK